ncbi:MAG: sulfatase-like hydrolase/transferase, partial [Candidatus Brocadiae bacterium]|nr:sulfatase-like hydrolase/transferase [Candidatus Brocadiia bacterium]
MAGEPTRPNFLFIITDQQRADTLGTYGCTLDATPNIDRMGAEGVVFRRGYCNNPLCMPSRASILTGRYPSVTGVRTNGCVARDGLPLLPELLAAAGYRTGAVGKIHYHPASAEPQGYWPENRRMAASDADLTRPYLGFQTIALGVGSGDVVSGLHSRGLKEQSPEVYAKRGPRHALVAPDPWLLEADKIQTYKTAIPEELYPTTWIVDRAIEFIEQADEPFFAWCGIPDPHHPFNPPGRYWDMFNPEDMPLPPRREGELEDKPPHFRGYYDGHYKDVDTDGFLLGCHNLTDRRLRLIRAAYYGMVAMIDDNVARLLDALRAKGVEENTVVVFVSDHGEFLGDHGFVLKGPMHYESVLRVPFILRCPALIPAGHCVEGLAGLIDLFPTILELAGVPVPDGTQGQSLLRQITGQSSRAHDEVYIENDVDRLGLRLRTIVTDR